jgi:hypothetical protein
MRRGWFIAALTIPNCGFPGDVPGSAESHPVEQVEKLGAKLEIQTFGELSLLHQAEIPVRDGGSPLSLEPLERRKTVAPGAIVAAAERRCP